MILVTGATGFLGKRVCKLLGDQGLDFVQTSLSLGTDLRSAEQTDALFAKVRPKFVLNCAAFVGGIQFGYEHPGELFTHNLLMTINILESSRRYGVTRIVNPISNCAYPGAATLFREEEFWDGPLHDSVLVYGFVRKASWVGSWAYAKQYDLDVLNLILSNMYGPEDHFEEKRSHALGALIMKIATARRDGLASVTVWGSGTPVREWLHVDDGAQAMVRGMEVARTDQPLNIGVGKGVSIRALAEMIQAIIGYKGALVFDTTRPDGAPYKTVDGSKGAAHFNWRPSRDLKQGIKEAADYYFSLGQ